MPALHAKVFGKVIGVGFRGFVWECCEQLLLSGWTKNCRDGSVEVWAEGERKKLERLLEALEKGPNTANVERVEVSWEPETGAKGFHVH